MIPRGKDGRVSGLYLAEALVGTGIAALSEDCFRKTEEGNELLKIPTLEKEAIQDPEIREALPELTESLVYLLYFAENDPALSFSLSGEDPAETKESWTGMRTFLLLREGRFSLKRGETEVLVFLSDEMKAEPGAEDFAEAFVDCLLRFSREEKLPLIFEGEEEPEPELQEPAAPEPELPEPEAPEPSFQIPAGTRETLTELDEMFTVLEEKSADAEEKSYQPFSYEKGQWIEGPGYRLPVPDDCACSLQEESHEFILWRPNEENPEEWEASPLVLIPGDRFPKNETDTERLFFLEDASYAVLLYEKPLDTAVQRFVLEFRAYAPDKKEDYIRTAVRLFAAIEIREA